MTCPECGAQVEGEARTVPVAELSVDLESLPDLIHHVYALAARALREEAEAAAHPEIARALERVAAMVEAGGIVG